MQANCLTTLRKVEGCSTFLATGNATITVAKWGVTREFFSWNLQRNATFVALQVARKISPCNMALNYSLFIFQQVTSLSVQLYTVPTIVRYCFLNDSNYIG